MAFVIFDIDGTILETARVTVPAVQRTMAAYGLPEPDADAICSFFGRPVEDYHAWLKALCPSDKAAEIVAATDRLELDLIGSEGRLYEGMHCALETLRDEGHVLAVCSNAPEDYLCEFLDAHDLRHFFTEIRCRGTRYSGKTEMIAELLTLVEARPAIVVGDRHDDIEAAHANGILAVAAAYGFGNDGEWRDADARIETPASLPVTVDRLISAGR
ncbi:MAG: HAD family hydrolase [FCB group bacterium]|jgi:phosphoglycolate phosphatase|nr:HAD family hydrolase [FCB group bacterium]